MLPEIILSERIYINMSPLMLHGLHIDSAIK
jgi:hypothetical protein